MRGALAAHDRHVSSHASRALRDRGRAAIAKLLAGIRVVVVEDHEDSRDILEQLLGFHGADVISATTARDALDAIAGADIVITDLSLPGEDGVWLLEQVNRLPRAVPVILISGYADVDHERLAAAPFARTLLKPLDPEDACQAIVDVLNRGA